MENSKPQLLYKSIKTGKIYPFIDDEETGRIDLEHPLEVDLKKEGYIKSGENNAFELWEIMD